MNPRAFAFAGALLAVGALVAQEATPAPKITGADQLVKKKGVFQDTWVRPDVDIAKYDKLVVWQPAFEFRDVGKPRGAETTLTTIDTTGHFAIRDEDRQRFAKVVSEAFVKELERSKLFQVVDKVGPNTLILRSGVTDIVSDVPPSSPSMLNVYMSSIGEATIIFQLIDAETGVIQATVAERQEIQPPGQVNTVSNVPVNENTVWINVERWARQAALELRKALEKAKKRAR